MKEKEEPGQLVGFEKMAQRILESFEKRMEQFIQQAVKQSQGTVYNLEGANLQNCAFNGNMTNNGSEKYYEERDSTKTPTYSDEQIAQALIAINGKDKVLSNYQLWLGACCYLMGRCNYSRNLEMCCNKINHLPYGDVKLDIECKYDNIRKFGFLRFVKEGVDTWDDYQPKEDEKKLFYGCKAVVNELDFRLNGEYE